jgi:hypothetical protein
VQEAGGGRGRERPWQAAATRIRLRSEQADPQAAIAAQALGAMWRERWFERARQAFAVPPPPGWRREATISQVYLTAEELTEIGSAVLEVISRHEDRIDPALRPDGAQAVDLMFFGGPVGE